MELADRWAEEAGDRLMVQAMQEFGAIELMVSLSPQVIADWRRRRYYTSIMSSNAVGTHEDGSWLGWRSGELRKQDKVFTHADRPG